MKKKHPTIAWIDEKTFLINCTCLALVIVLGAAYIIQINSTVAQGYEMRELETKIQKMSLENQRMEVQVRKTKSLENVERNVKMLGLVPAETPDYVDASAPAYALAD